MSEDLHADDDADDLIGELPDLDRPEPGDETATLDDDAEERLHLGDEATAEDGDDGPTDARALDADLETLADEPSVLGDERDGPVDEADTVEDLDGPSFVGPEELADTDEDHGIADALPMGNDDGGVEGLDDPEGDELDELPPLDGQMDDDRDDVSSETEEALPSLDPLA
ncbi:MAG: hypothetical protein FJ096_03180 [Deltaproteobacteria bacterium]|nr:hypothetical protein [Deltaproteobacteria bacterium]